MVETRAIMASGLVAFAALAACASAQPGEQRLTIVRPPEETSSTGGISPDKRLEIDLVLQQRDPSARKCYQDVMNEKHDRSFQGTVQLVITIQPSGQASQVKILGGTLGDQTVAACLVETIKGFEFPRLAQAGDVEYTYTFKPQY